MSGSWPFLFGGTFWAKRETVEAAKVAASRSGRRFIGRCFYFNLRKVPVASGYGFLLISRYVRFFTLPVPGSLSSIRICFRNQRPSIFCPDTTSKYFESFAFQS